MAGTLQIISRTTTKAQAGQVLAPAVKVQHLAVQWAYAYSGKAVLLNASGDAIGYLQTVNGVPSNDDKMIEYTFANLVISAPGTYRIRLYLYGISTESADEVHQITFDEITVSN